MMGESFLLGISTAVAIVLLGYSIAVSDVTVQTELPNILVTRRASIAVVECRKV
jgi:flagellar motor component MotA